MKQVLILLLSVTLSLSASAKNNPDDAPKREFRGAWIQCVNGQFLGKTPAEIRSMLSSQLDVLKEAHINAIVFQVRPECDALYKSSFEPWSRFLSGTQGVAPDDGWDPLQWMIEQCHKRGMECHAWINPYRAKTKGTVALAGNHVALRHPDRVFEYDGLYILNPALESNRMYTCMVVEDIITRYDVDGIHMDDYFYPYPVAGHDIPDQADYEADPRGFKDIGDWRRDNVNMLIRDLHELIHSIKPWVKFGISPFGIYRNDPSGQNTRYGSATNGLQNYDDLYADIVLWQDKGWIDYLVPQIYWNIGTKAADYEVLCHWWNDYCSKRPLYIGQDVERTVKGSDPDNPQRHQMIAKYDLQRSLSNIQGSCQWYAAAVVNNPGNYRTLLQRTYHAHPALQPLMPFIDKKAPKAPARLRVITTQNGPCLVWKTKRAKHELDKAVAFAIYDFAPGEKINLDNANHLIEVKYGSSFILKDRDFSGHTLVITALDRLHNESKPAKLKL